MALCPDCEEEIDIDDHERGDFVTCGECGSDLVVQDDGDGPYLVEYEEENDDYDDEDDDY